MNYTPEWDDVVEQLARPRILELEAEIEQLRAPWQAVDSMDWEYIMSALGDGGRDRFWKAVLTEMRQVLEEKT